VDSNDRSHVGANGGSNDGSNRVEMRERRLEPWLKRRSASVEENVGSNDDLLTSRSERRAARMMAQT
jgi:hypothetical protein